MSIARNQVGVVPLLVLVLFWHQATASDQLAFEPLAGFPQLPKTVTLGPCSAVSIDSRGGIYLFNRGKQPIIRLDAQGRFVESWGQDDIVSSHGLRIDGDDNVWVTDWRGHRVLKYDKTGKLLLSLGTGKPGDGPNQFNQPTDVAFGRRGELYVADGYGNSRVMKFSPNGAFIMTWGSRGKGRGQFDLPHCVLVDRSDRVLVGDRENNRIQVFDEDGQLLEIWKGFAPYGMAQSATGELFVADGRANKVLLLDDDGEIEQSWGGKGTAPGQFLMPHMLAVDAAGNLLVAEVTGQRLQKFERK